MRRNASVPFLSSPQGIRRTEQRAPQLLPGEVKKLLLASSLSLFVSSLLFIFITSPATPPRHRLHPLPSSYHPTSTSWDDVCLERKGYSILINTWKRNELLKQSVSHYASCVGVESIHIIWSEPRPPPNSLHKILRQSLLSKHKTRHEIKLKFDLNEENSLNNRFKEIKDLSTDAVFSIDDDVVLPCSTVEFAFTVWQSAPNVMVGFVPRLHWTDRYNGSMVRYRYGGWWSVWWQGTYSMILSKASFFHKKYLYLYMNEMQSSIRDYITRNRNCEDIAMSFLVANVSQAPPVWVKGRIHEMGWTGISSLVGHNERRTQCLNDFTLMYGYMPLISTHAKVVDSRDTWFW